MTIAASRSIGDLAFPEVARRLRATSILLLPVGAHSYSEALEMAVAVYRTLGAVLQRHGLEGTLVGAGGFAAIGYRWAGTTRASR